MTVSSTTSRTTYAGTGSAGPFAFNFRILSEDDLRLIRVDRNGVETVLTRGRDYTVGGVGSATGSITLSRALAIGESLTVRRAPELLQPISLFRRHQVVTVQEIILIHGSFLVIMLVSVHPDWEQQTALSQARPM